MTDPFFRRAEAEWLREPDGALEMCPVCGSIDINAQGICTHCGASVDERSTYEKRQHDH